MNLKAADRRKLNNLPELKALSTGHHSYQKYTELWQALMDAVSEKFGLNIQAVVLSGTDNPSRRNHPLHIEGTEDETVENCFLTVSIYKMPHGSIEFTGYFS